MFLVPEEPEDFVISPEKSSSLFAEASAVNDRWCLITLFHVSSTLTDIENESADLLSNNTNNKSLTRLG